MTAEPTSLHLFSYTRRSHRPVKPTTPSDDSVCSANSHGRIRCRCRAIFVYVKILPNFEPAGIASEKSEKRFDKLVSLLRQFVKVFNAIFKSFDTRATFVLAQFPANGCAPIGRLVVAVSNHPCAVHNFIAARNQSLVAGEQVFNNCLLACVWWTQLTDE